MVDVLEVGHWMQATYPTRNWTDQCERGDWNAVYYAKGQGVEQRGYSTATLSFDASKIDRHSIAELQPGDSAWFEFGAAGHTMTYVGNDAFLGCTTRGTRLYDFGRGLVIVRASDFPMTFLGGASHHGDWPSVTITSDSLVPPAPTSSLRLVQGDGVTYYEPVGSLAQRIGAQLIARHRTPVALDNDGDPGSNWRKGVQNTIKVGVGYTGPSDGALGHVSLTDVQAYAKRYGSYTGPLDGDPREQSWSGFALGLERP